MVSSHTDAAGDGASVAMVETVDAVVLPLLLEVDS